MNTLARFLVLLFVFSVPFWLAAVFFDATQLIPVKLPWSALQFLAVLIAAILFAFRAPALGHERAA